MGTATLDGYLFAGTNIYNKQIASLLWQKLPDDLDRRRRYWGYLLSDVKWFYKTKAVEALLGHGPCFYYFPTGRSPDKPCTLITS